MARRGAPKKHKSDAARKRSERAAARDRGTPECQLKRASAVRGAQLELAESPLGIMEARNHITVGQAKAGADYARLHWLIYGSCFAKVSSDLVSGGSLGGLDDMERDRRRQDSYIAADKALRAAGRIPRKKVRELVLSQESPRWLFENVTHGKKALLAGLAALEKHWG